MKRFVIVSLVFSLCIFGHLFGRPFQRHCFGCGVAVIGPAIVASPVVSACQSSAVAIAPVAVQTLAIPSVAVVAPTFVPTSTVVAAPVVATPTVVVQEEVRVKANKAPVRARNARVRVFVR